MGRFVARTVLVAAGLLVGFLFVEAALRLGLVDNPRHAYLRADGDAGGGSGRLLLLGDSFIDKATDGAFHRELVARLGAAGYAVFNLGVSGTGPEDYLQTLRTHGERIDPDLVVLFYFAGNDLINVLQYEPYRATGPFASLRDAARDAVHEIHLYHVATAASSQVEFDFEGMLADGHDPELVDLARTGEVNPWLLLIPAEARARYLATNLELESPESRRGVERLREILAEVRATSERLGARLLVVVFPGTTQVSDSHFDFYRRAGFDPDPRTLEANAPQQMMAELTAAEGVPMLDLLPVLRAVEGVALYRPNDSHLNDQGNALAAAHVARFVLAHASGAPPSESRRVRPTDR